MAGSTSGREVSVQSLGAGGPGVSQQGSRLGARGQQGSRLDHTIPGPRGQGGGMEQAGPHEPSSQEPGEGVTRQHISPVPKGPGGLVKVLLPFLPWTPLPSPSPQPNLAVPALDPPPSPLTSRVAQSFHSCRAPGPPPAARPQTGAGIFGSRPQMTPGPLRYSHSAHRGKLERGGAEGGGEEDQKFRKWKHGMHYLLMCQAFMM